MSDFTMYLRDVVKIRRGDIGLDSYPIFDEAHRLVLNQKITDHYWYREIGFETTEMFINRLRVRMNEIMPYYNQLYESERIKYDPLISMDISGNSNADGVADGTTNAKSNTKTKGGSKSRNVSSQFPQHMLQGNGDYATAGADATSDTTNQSDATNTTTSKSTNKASNRHASRGRQIPAQQLIMQYRQALLNIDMMVVGDLADLFMTILDSREEERYWYHD